MREANSGKLANVKEVGATIDRLADWVKLRPTPKPDCQFRSVSSCVATINQQEVTCSPAGRQQIAVGSRDTKVLG